jgi:hypothetical protein
LSIGLFEYIPARHACCAWYEIDRGAGLAEYITLPVLVVCFVDLEVDLKAELTSGVTILWEAKALLADILNSRRRANVNPICENAHLDASE